MKRLFLIFALVLLVAGATIGAMKWFGLGPFQKPEIAKEMQAPEKITAPQALFVDMEPLLVNVVQGGAIATTIQIEVKIETAGNENIIRIKRMLPQYKDAFLKDLHAFIPRMLSELGRIDLPTLKQRLQLVADRVAGEKGVVKGVLIQSLLDTPQ
ncbi:MAG: flagellar basal body-associated FliL family protein [Rhodospirillales bacterium]